MKLQTIGRALLVSVGVLAISTTGVAATDTFHDSFNNNFAEQWDVITYESNQLFRDTFCGVTSCGSLLSEDGTKFFRLALHTNAVAGEYSDTEIREEPHDAPINGGSWTPTTNHPVVFETRVRFNEGHNFDGSGGAVGTAGLGLWNNAQGSVETGANPDYDSLTFVWVDDDFTDFFGADGFSAVTSVNIIPAGVSRPSPINLQDWNDLKFIWSVDAAGQQRVEYFVNGSSIGVHVLPIPLSGLNVIAWQDNQVYNDFFQSQYLVPIAEQYFDMDFVKVHQLD